MGIGFLILALALSGRAGSGALWLLLPGFIVLGRGIGELVSLLTAERSANRIAAPPVAQNTSALQPLVSYDPLAPPSVTEGTTRHLDTASQESHETK